MGFFDKDDKKPSEEELLRQRQPLPPREKLPPALQKIVDKAEKDESIYDELWDGTAPESTDSNVRYAAYASRLRTVMLSAHRYVAYTSDIGESFRPVAHPNWIRTAYGISWAYLIGDVSHEGYKAYCRNQRILHPDLPREASLDHYNNATEKSQLAAAGTVSGLAPRSVAAIDDFRTVMLQRALFQGIASMGLPALTIHSIVKYSGKALKGTKNVAFRTWAPIGLGLSAVPALPFIFDEPVEKAVEFIFHVGFRWIGGPNAVGYAPPTGREDELSAQNKLAKKKDN